MGDNNFAVAIAAALPVVIAAVPAGPGSALGRLRLAPERRPWPVGHPESPVVKSLRELPGWVVERVHGALELTVAALRVPAPEVAAGLPPAPSGSLGFLSSDSEPEALRETRLLASFRPGTLDLVAALVTELADHDLIAPLLVAGPGDEASITAGHGSAHLALAVVVATVVLREVGCPEVPAIVGTSLGVAADLLRARPLPAGYDDALLEKRRAEYLLPQRANTHVQVRDHLFALAEGPFPQADGADGFAANGLVDVAEGGVVIRTGAEQGAVSVSLLVRADPPEDAGTLGWEEVVEVSWRARRGGASLLGPDQPSGQVSACTPPWPGDYRVRVHAYGRDDVDVESYSVEVWEAPFAPPLVHARADRLGHRLRGEPEPALVDRPEVAYRWVEHSRLSVAATVTVVTGASLEDVLRGFGADPAEPVEPGDLREQFGLDSWVTVLEVGGAVLAIEENGYQGSHEPVLSAISRHGRAASMFWNVNGLTRLSFAQHGELLDSFEPGLARPGDRPEVADALAGLDLEDFRDRTGKGLVAVERFTGVGLHAEDLEGIEAAANAYRIAGG